MEMAGVTREAPRQSFAEWVREGLRVRSSAATLGAGIGAVVSVLLGGFLVVLFHGFTPDEAIVAAIRSTEMLAVMATGVVLGTAGIVAGFAIYRRMPTRRSREQALAGAILGIQAVVLAIGLLLFREVGNPERFTFHFLNFNELDGYMDVFLTGAKNTLLLAFVGEMGGIVLGLLLAVLVISKRRTVRAPARAYINFFRGTPLVWQLSIFYFGFALGLGFLLSTYISAMVVFALNTGAYAAEVFRAGIQSIERGQMEAARGLGMSYPQAMAHAVVPQAVRRVIPPLMNEFVILIKDASLIFVLGLAGAQYDLYTAARIGYSDTSNATVFVAAALGYLAVTLPLIWVVNQVERRLRSGLVSVG
jgi:His/Glu/Gln/Arg/opine family amino acid ABC transporter permease subunit